ncbi:MAG: hypothetical protein AB7U92_19395 [Piscinibacter sp.]|uniref:hypothetical protein n=1 Tax=Piscinibacter sp. TaxID=1903157 RepID=UPI003D11AD7A
MNRTASTARQVADQAIETVQDGLDTLESRTTPALVRAAERADDLIGRSANVLRDGAGQVRTKATEATERTADYIREQPVKSVLIAAAGGAALMALASYGASRRERR